MNIEEHKTKMTIFYSRQTGDIKNVVGGIQNLDFYRDNKIDFEIIYDFLVIDIDNYIFENSSLFKVNEGRVILKDMPQINKYI